MASAPLGPTLLLVTTARTRNPTTSPWVRCQPAAVQVSVSEAAWASGVASGDGAATTHHADGALLGHGFGEGGERMLPGRRPELARTAQRDPQPGQARPGQRSGHGEPAIPPPRLGGDHQAGGEVSTQVGEETGVQGAGKVDVPHLTATAGRRGQRLHQGETAGRTPSGCGEHRDTTAREPAGKQPGVEHERIRRPYAGGDLPAPALQGLGPVA